VVLVAGTTPQAEAAINMMLASAKQLQHLASVVAVGRFTENLALAFGHGVAADDEAAIGALGDVASLLKGQAGDQLGRRLAAADAALGEFGRGRDGELIAGFGEKLFAARGSAGEDEGKRRHVGKLTDAASVAIAGKRARWSWKGSGVDCAGTNPIGKSFSQSTPDPVHSLNAHFPRLRYGLVCRNAEADFGSVV